MVDYSMATHSESFSGQEAVSEESKRIAKRTSFVSRFIVLREGRRSRAHRIIEEMTWGMDSTLDDLYEMFREAFIENGDKLQSVDRDLRRAKEHAECSMDHFVNQYIDRSTLSFRDALQDYERSNRLLFGDDPSDVPRSGGWRLSTLLQC